MTSLEHIHAAMRKSTERAVTEAVTLRLGTISAVSSTGVTVAIDGSDPITNVPVMDPYTPRVGDIARVALFGHAALVLGGLSVPAAREAYVGNSSTYSVTATTIGSLSTPLRLAFFAPRSGIVTVNARARLTPTATARAYASVRILDSTLAVSQVDTASLLEVAAGAGSTALGSFARFSGLTPAATYYAELIAATGTAGQTISLQYPRLQVIPER